MDPQIAFRTDIPEPDTDYACFVKAKDKGEITFTLRSQDATADLVVDFWILTQLRVRQFMESGHTLQSAVNEVRILIGVPEYPPVLKDLKLDGAARIAREMEQAPNRKVAD